ncbi:cytochrome c oxidase assembly protein [Flexibacterium corallicola]|uniref:cytochrome c oxidase assembly protein n=1 Tax=Flexibacterium corallicola TaxID=3037259 RepID=UPI00286F7C17|nr:cytochrome c oxidase assembly protein [Pseudovibrio sp. M1P-2-3]
MEQKAYPFRSKRAEVKRNARVALLCGGVFVSMVGVAYGAVPLYQLFCQVTGYGGTTQRAEAAEQMVLDREIVVRFDANTSKDLPWDFSPKQKAVRIKLGQVSEIAYLARNIAPSKTIGTSSFNVSPSEMGRYFNKIDCFCFTEQPLAGGEAATMPVLFFIDPDMDQDDDLKHVKEVTLSYTFFKVDSVEDKTEISKSMVNTESTL